MDSGRIQRRSRPAELGKTVGDLFGALATFADAEARLAEAEAGASLKATKQGLSLIGLGLGAGLLGTTWLLGVGVSLLSNALPTWLGSEGVRRHLSAGLIGLGLVAGGAKLALVGKDKLPMEPLKRTQENLGQMKEAITGE